MGRGSYLGGSSVIRPGEDGTVWNGEPQPKSGNKPAKRRRIRSDLAPTARHIAEVEAAERKGEASAERSFISMCAKAYADGQLTERHPKPPRPIAYQVSARGGNVKWLGCSKDRQIQFHRAYCKHRGEAVPFERVWATGKTA